MNLSKLLTTTRDVAEKMNLSPTTIQRFLKKHQDHPGVVRMGKFTFVRTKNIRDIERLYADEQAKLKEFRSALAKRIQPQGAAAVKMARLGTEQQAELAVKITDLTRRLDALEAALGVSDVAR